MAESCGAPHPEHPTRLCQMQGTHADHLDYAHPTDPWPNAEAQQQMALRRSHGTGRGRRGRKAAMAEVAATVVVAKRGELLPEAREKWAKEPWTAYATEIFMGFMRGREEPFTTAEHVWPLLECPEEMRAMSVVTQRLLRGGAMREHGAVRLRGTYRTKDGVEFKENKLVPVYRSLI